MASAKRVIEQMFVNWVEPELRRRGLPTDRYQVRKALVELSPVGGVVVHLNQEARFIGRAVARRSIEAGC